MVQIGTKATELDTPCLLVDLDRMETNISRWQAAISATGANLRPHIKTHKVPAIAHIQIAAGAAGITVINVSEAEVFAAHGCRDIFVASPVIGPEKWRRVAELARASEVAVGFDSEIGARGLSAAAMAAGVTIRVRAKVDTGLHRAGVPPAEVEALCRLAMSLPGLELDGLYTFRSIYFADAGGRSPEELGHEEGEIMVSLAERLRSAGIPVREISVGSTATGRSAARVPGITEVRPGTYIFGDYMNSALGIIDEDDIALSILCTVLSRPARDRATIDGGSKTFSGDIYPGRLNLKGYAKAVGVDAYLISMYEEHGALQLGPDAQLKVGDKIALHPIHVCTTVNLSDELVGVRQGRVEKVWPVLARGKRT